jgi:histidyl-tRNA synthetase
VAQALSELGFDDFVIRLNHRQLLTALLEGAGLPPAQHAGALVSIDKLDKVPHDAVVAELVARGVDAEHAGRLLEAFTRAAAQSNEELLASFDAAVPATAEAGRRAVDNLRSIVALAADGPAAGRLRLDPSLARGLSYYTGAIMEIQVADLAGSLGGGGRYDNLVGMFAGQEIPACGFSLGLERILVVMTERGMFPPSLPLAPADVMVAAFGASGPADALRVADRLRGAGLRVLVYPDADKIGKQIKYADGRRIPFVALVGDEEMKAGTVTVKDLAAQTQHTYDQGAAGAAIREALTQRG